MRERSKYSAASSFILIIIFAIFAAVLFFGCSSSSSSSSSIRVMPISAYVSVEATQQFRCYAYRGTTNTGTVEATWAVIGGVGTIDVTGLFYATAEGSGTIEATYGSLTAYATVTCTITHESGELVSIEVSPVSATIKSGGTQTFAGTGYDINRAVVTFTPTWSVDDTSIGTIDAVNGIFYGAAQGSTTVNCTSGEVVGHATVTVEGYIVEITAEADSYVDSGSPEANHGTDTSLTASYNATLGTSLYVYLKFPTSSIPATASIESASLKLYVSSTDGTEFVIYLVSTTWAETTVKWSNKPTEGDYLTNKSFTSGSYNTVSASEITTAAQNWLDGTSSNYGVIIRKATAAAGSVEFLSRHNSVNKPMLRVEYTVP
ncbi:MAG: DNRLRE domain-containing protein [Candidatus Margulisiibacteriota bacterium]